LVAWLCGTVFIDRANSTKSRTQISTSAESLKKNRTKLWIFPEGTRNKGETLLPFKKGAFHIAIQNKLPIVPVLISPYTFIDDGKHEFGSGRMIISVLPLIETDDIGPENLNEFIEQTRDIVKGSVLIDKYLTCLDNKQKDEVLKVEEFVTDACRVFSQKRCDLAVNYFADNVVIHWGLNHTLVGTENFLKICQTTEALDEFHFLIDDLVVQGNEMAAAKVAIRFRICGKWMKPLENFQPNQKNIQSVALSILYIQDAKIVEMWISSQTEDSEWNKALAHFFNLISKKESEGDIFSK